LLLFTLLGAMAIALAVTAGRLHRAEAQLDEYRREYGILKIDDPTRLCAVALWVPQPRSWRWRVNFPTGRYWVSCKTAGIIETGVPVVGAGLNREFSGPTEVSAVIFRDQSDGLWKCVLSAGGETSCVHVPPTLGEDSASRTTGVVWRKGTITAEDDQLVLLRHRVGKKVAGGGSTLNLMKPSDGLLVWIARQTATNDRSSAEGKFTPPLDNSARSHSESPLDITNRASMGIQ
jgi:hypothetical protein